MIVVGSDDPEVSAAIAETSAAFSINFTPSHNPFQYHGYKFNPADGGRHKELTGPVTARANELLHGSRAVRMLDEGLRGREDARVTACSTPSRSTGKR